MNTTIDYLEGQSEPFSSEFSSTTVLLFTSLLVIPPTIYYSSFSLQKSKTWQDYQKYYQHMKVLSPYLLPQSTEDARNITGLLAAILACVGAGRVINICAPLLLRNSLSQILARDLFPWKGLAGYAVLDTLIRNTVFWVQWALTQRLQNQVSDRVTIAVYDKLMSLSADYHDGKDSSSVWLAVRNSGSDVSRFASRAAFQMAPNALDLVLAIATFGKVCGHRLGWLLSSVLFLYAMIRVMLPYYKKGLEEWNAAQEKRDGLSSSAITNWWTVGFFGRLEYEKDRHAQAVHHSRAIDAQWCESQWLDYMIRHQVSSLGFIILCLTVGYGIWSDPTRTITDFQLLLSLWHNVLASAQDILHWGDYFKNFSESAKKLIEIIQEDITVQDMNGAKDLKVEEGAITVENISFSYPEKTQAALQDVSLTIEGRKTVGIVGRSGGGKSTLLKLLLRSYDPKSGRILIDGQDIKTVGKASLVKHIGIVPQNIGVFNTSILENLRYARLDVTREQCEEACRAVGLHDKISTAFDKGYDEVIGENGVKLSGGELQRLAIARVLLRDTKIILFDEATSNLDAETESKVQEYLQKWCVGRTVVIIAHRLVTVQRADLIVAIKDGQIVEKGTHRELLEKKGYFWELWDKQRLE